MPEPGVGRIRVLPTRAAFCSDDRPHVESGWVTGLLPERLTVLGRRRRDGTD